MMRFATAAHQNDIGVIIAGAGGAAHLPGMSLLLVLSKGTCQNEELIDGGDFAIDGNASGVPVATVALDGAERLICRQTCNH